MNQGPIIFLGLLVTAATSWWSLVAVPQLQLGDQRTVTVDNRPYPSERPGLARQGQAVFQAQGCVECHTQQVQPAGYGADLERDWGRRQSVAQDYLRESPLLLGNQRIGPDLANVSLRQTNEVWHLQHLYNPRITSPGSIMPPYPFLFEKRKVGRHPSPNALPLPKEFAPEAGYEIIPKPEAYALVAYLMNLQSDVPLFEAPIPKPATNQADQATSPDAPAATTDSPAQ